MNASDSRIKNWVPGVICKIDFEKAFDHVLWEFVDEVLKMMGFGELWRKWVQGCITNTPTSVLINGSAHNKFTTGKGLMQCDPLSPFLFLIVSEALNLLFQAGHESGHLGGFSMSVNGNKVSHLQFADDTLAFLDDSIEQINYLRYYLLGFEMMSGLRINFAKCSLFGVADATNLEVMSAMMGCKTDFLPSNYLGLPLGYKATNAQKWEEIIERC